MVQEGAGLALLLGAADHTRRRRLVQEVADGALDESLGAAPPKLGGAHASVSDLDASHHHLRSLQHSTSHYPAYYSSYYHYYYGYPTTEMLHQQQDTTPPTDQSMSSLDHTPVSGSPLYSSQAAYNLQSSLNPEYELSAVTGANGGSNSSNSSIGSGGSSAPSSATLRDLQQQQHHHQDQHQPPQQQQTQHSQQSSNSNHAQENGGEASYAALPSLLPCSSSVSYGLPTLQDFSERSESVSQDAGPPEPSVDPAASAVVAAANSVAAAAAAAAVAASATGMMSE